MLSLQTKKSQETVREACNLNHYFYIHVKKLFLGLFCPCLTILLPAWCKITISIFLVLVIEQRADIEEWENRLICVSEYVLGCYLNAVLCLYVWLSERITPAG